jgi:hypothetical protein
VFRGFSSALAFLLVLGVAVLPVAAELHLTFARHAHRFCAEHNRFEDVRIERTGATASDPGPNSSSEEVLRRAASGMEVTFVPCAASTTTVEGSPEHQRRTAIALQANGHDRPPGNTEAARTSSALFFDAPKQSPPVRQV